jgi:AraC family transcriptional regulator
MAPVHGKLSPAIQSLVRNSTLLAPSSVVLGWEGIAIEHHIVAPRLRPEVVVDHYLLAMWGKTPTEGERASRKGRFVRYRKMPGSITTCLPGPVPAVRAFATYEAVFCALSPAVIRGVEDELDRRPLGTPHELYGTLDPALHRLMSLLGDEAREGGPNGRIYVETLTLALATRLIYAGRSVAQPASVGTVPLSRHRLRRVLERIHTHFHTNLNLAELAAEAGYSRAHFIRMFRAAVGRTPHRYLLDYRLEKAQALLVQGSLPVTAIAAACGFVSHAHFSTAFRARFAVAPSDYRRLRLHR